MPAMFKEAQGTAMPGTAERLRLLIDTIPALVHGGLPDGTLDFFNQRWLDYLGMGLEDLRGWRWTAAIHTDDVDTMLARWRSSLQTGEPAETEARVRRADGAYRWFLHRTVPLRDAHGQIISWVGTSTDIEERKQAEEWIRHHERELRMLVDTLPLHIYVIGPRGETRYPNRVARDYHGLSLEEFQAPDFNERVIHPDDADRVRAEMEQALATGGPCVVETRLRGKDGRYRWFLFNSVPMRDEEGHVTRWCATGTEIESRKQAEERVHKENLVLREELSQSAGAQEIVGTSEPLRHVLSLIGKVAPTDSTVLITGETGTGKELVARAIHRSSHRAERPFIRVNCAAIPLSLIASELFGHEKGAFTGATQRRLGRFELGDGGTVFLDEVGELPAETQIALLRVLQERELERVGGAQPVPVDVRVLAATNRDLSAAVAAGTFRMDLFYRLNVFPIHVPPLRERAADIPLLVASFTERYAGKAGKRISCIDRRSLELLQGYRWPGNIRELQNVVERSVILCESEVLSADESWLQPEAPRPSCGPVPLPATLAGKEREMIEAALVSCQGRVSGPGGAASLLGMPRTTLESRIRSLGIDKHRFRSP